MHEKTQSEDLLEKAGVCVFHRGRHFGEASDTPFCNFFGHTRYALKSALPSLALQATCGSRQALFPGSRRRCDDFHHRLPWLVGTAPTRCKYASTRCAGSWPSARGAVRQRQVRRPWHHSATAARWLGCMAAVTRSCRPCAESLTPVFVAAALGFPPCEN